MTWLIFSCQLYDEMPLFHRRFHTAAPVSDFVSPRFPPLHHSRHDDTLLLSSCASLHRRRPLQPGSLNTYHLRQPPRKMKDLRAGASRGPYVGCSPGGGGVGGGSAAVSTFRSPGQIREETDGRLGSGRALTLAVDQRKPHRGGGGSARAQKSACRCLLAL